MEEFRGLSFNVFYISRSHLYSTSSNEKKQIEEMMKHFYIPLLRTLRLSSTRLFLCFPFEQINRNFPFERIIDIDTHFIEVYWADVSAYLLESVVRDSVWEVHLPRDGATSKYSILTSVWRGYCPIWAPFFIVVLSISLVHVLSESICSSLVRSEQQSHLSLIDVSFGIHSCSLVKSSSDLFTTNITPCNCSSLSTPVVSIEWCNFSYESTINEHHSRRTIQSNGYSVSL